MNSAIKKLITPVAKLGLISVLLYFLIDQGFISIQATRQAFRKWEIILPTFGLLFCTSILGAVRWKWLLQAQSIHLPWKKIFQLTLIGNFFNVALPGAVSGDLVKVFYVGREVRGQKSRILGSIVFDRVAGLSALVLVSSGALLFGFRGFQHTPLLTGIQVMLGTGAASVLFLFSYLFLVSESKDPLLSSLQWMEKKVPKASIFVRVYEGLRDYHHHRLTVLKVLAISILVHLIVGLGCFQLARALGELDLSLLSTYVIVPLGLLVTAVPIAPGGVGTGNIAFLYFFHLIGSERGADIYSLYAVMNLILNTVGAYFYFRYKGQPQLAELETLSAETLSP